MSILTKAPDCMGKNRLRGDCSVNTLGYRYGMSCMSGAGRGLGTDIECSSG